MMDDIRRKILPLASRLRLESLVSLTDQQVIFPFYHVVSDEYLPHIRHLYRYRNVDQFDKDLDELLAIFEPLSLGEYLEGPERKRGRRCMVLSFDDGLWECHQVIAPVLKKKGVPAVFFLNNQFIDNRGLFYRYKASIIIDRILSDCKSREKAAEFLVVSDEQVADAIRIVNYRQQPLLDAIADIVEVDFQDYIKECPVYLSSQQVMELLDMGFEIGGHSPDHVDFTSLDPGEMINQVRNSVLDIQRRFVKAPGYFSFPFTSHSVPGDVIDQLLNDKMIRVLFGTAGLKKTWDQRFIQRIPMEGLEVSAKQVLKTEYLYYIMKAVLGKNAYKR
jgi:peptidoglycan/xylan/chitin deacetylase (PgdA/CDA1 family)